MKKQFDKLFIEFEEGNKKSLDKAVAEAKRLGYNEWESSIAMRLEGIGILLLNYLGEYFISSSAKETLIYYGYTEHKIQEEVIKEKTNKSKLLDILKSPNDKLICVDLDGTLSEGEFWGEGEPKPIQERIDYINSIYKKGAHIIIYTARSPEFYQITHSWLIKYGVKFHGICMQHKPGADLYIDDKALNVDDLF